jgi:O-methyltransferase involved in polyketide biosynthesis
MSTGTELDVTTPNEARAYDYLLGGRESFAADREMADRIAALYPPGAPGPRELAARNRVFLGRAVSSACHDRIGQVLDLGAGFPARDPLHEAARAARAGVRCAYVDLDPRVAAHGMAATQGLDGVTYAHADLTRPGDVMADPDVRPVIDPARPVLAVFGLVLHFLDASEARRVIEGWADWLPAGSRFAVTVAHWADEKLHERISAVYGPGRIRNHTPAQVHAMLRGLELLGGGVEVARGWAPEAIESPGPGHILAAVARKP